MFSQMTTSSPVANLSRHVIRRAQTRRQDAGVNVLVADKSFRVMDWSEAGLRFDMPRDDSNIAGIYYEARPLPAMKVGDQLPLTLAFRVMGEIVRMSLDSRVIRHQNGQVVVRFVDLPAATRRQFMRVKDLLNAEAFLASQAISYQA